MVRQILDPDPTTFRKPDKTLFLLHVTEVIGKVKKNIFSV